MPIETAEDWHAAKKMLQWAGQAMFNEAMSNMTKTVKGHEAAKTWLQWAVKHI